MTDRVRWVLESIEREPTQAQKLQRALFHVRMQVEKMSGGVGRMADLETIIRIAQVEIDRSMRDIGERPWDWTSFDWWTAATLADVQKEIHGLLEVHGWEW